MTKKINDFSNYTISEDGIVVNTKTNYIKSQWVGANGYKHVDLQQDGRRTKISVHRLIALHFIPNPESKRTVNHKDGNKLNNLRANLEWATDSENNQHAYDTQLKIPKRKVTALEGQTYFTGRIMTGTTITALAKELGVGLTQLSYRIKEASVALGMEAEYKEELKRQKLVRQAKKST